ncbi:hypothetical protein RvY_07928-2 [Ramazzottius varieornatus]|uniref:Uncharacterized protein n=1 Tax=Ramazzottius varieornatus TaxID=947166 RepID=A0A1D1VC82_RAMVA|nr:hypothetical protein RvY_07928-2 [Ramazzottius varieornatus]
MGRLSLRPFPRTINHARINSLPQFLSRIYIRIARYGFIFINDDIAPIALLFVFIAGLYCQQEPQVFDHVKPALTAAEVLSSQSQDANDHPHCDITYIPQTSFRCADKAQPGSYADSNTLSLPVPSLPSVRIPWRVGTLPTRDHPGTDLCSTHHPPIT